MSVVPDYNKLCRFNIVALVDPDLLKVENKGIGKRRREGAEPAGPAKARPVASAPASAPARVPAPADPAV